MAEGAPTLRPPATRRGVARWCGLALVLIAGCAAPTPERAPAAEGSDATEGTRTPAADASSSPAAVEVTFLDVGQGDAVLVRAPDGRAVLVDAGRDASIVDDLRDLGVERLELLVASHPHADHIGGMEAVLASVPVRFYMDNGQPHTTATYLELMRTLRARSDVTYLEATERTVTLGSVILEILPLPSVATDDHNDHSIGLVVRHGRFAALLTGDSERREVTWWAERGVVPDVVLLKAAHHGSANGFTPAFLEAARPELVVVSLGANGYGHPHAAALEAYRSVGAELYRTDVRGRVTVLGFEDGSYEVRTER